MQQQNYFELFGLSPAFFIDTDKLANAYRALQRQFHPDRFVSASAQEQRIALQYATTINEANQCLKSPLLRAQYLLELAGYVQKEHTMQNDPQFLFQQMEWRDQLEEARNNNQLQQLQTQAAATIIEYQNEFSDLYEQKNYVAAQHIVDKMHFVTKFEKELSARLGSLAES